jgi:hypothetical protein
MEHWWVRMNLDNAWRDELIRQAEHERLVQLCKGQSSDRLGRLLAWLKETPINHYFQHKTHGISPTLKPYEQN